MHIVVKRAQASTDMAAVAEHAKIREEKIVDQRRNTTALEVAKEIVAVEATIESNVESIEKTDAEVKAEAAPEKAQDVEAMVKTSTQLTDTTSPSCVAPSRQ